MLNLIPLPYRIILFVALLASMFSFGYYRGTKQQQEIYTNQQQKDAITFYKAGIASVKVTEKVVVQYKDRVVERIKIVTKNKESINENIAATDTIPVGFVRLHDKAIANENGDATGSTRIDEATSAISSVNLRQASSVIIDNYSACYLWKDQLVSLQAWITQQQELYPPSQ